MDPIELCYFKTKLSVNLLNPANCTKILVVGCGDGHEVRCLSDMFPNAFVHGVDLKLEAETVTEKYKIFNASALALPFEDNTFDFVYSYHVLEHVGDPNTAISEIFRVLKPGASFFVGTPNRSRLIGYFSAPGSFMDNVNRNLRDWAYRLKFRFRNEYGAHAGFSEKELSGMLKEKFSTVNPMTRTYYHKFYPQHQGKINFLLATRISELLFPAVYFHCIK